MIVIVTRLFFVLIFVGYAVLQLPDLILYLRNAYEENIEAWIQKYKREKSTGSI